MLSKNNLSLLVFISCLLFTGTLKPLKSEDTQPLDKVLFDISAISPEGLVGSPEGLHSVSYEFCIPEGLPFLADIQLIDPTIQIYPNSRGRIGCSSAQSLCIANTGKLYWKDILLSIAKLEYVKKIDLFYGE